MITRSRLPSRERLRLMDVLRQLAPNVWLPTQAALALSLDMLGGGAAGAGGRRGPPDRVPDIWALTSSDRRAVALYRTGRIEEMMHDFCTRSHRQVSCSSPFRPRSLPTPRRLPPARGCPAGSSRSSRSIRPLFANDVRRRRTIYVSVALSGIALMLLAGVAGGRSMRRHLRVARLKTDLVAAASHELRTPLASMRVLVDGLLADPEFDPAKTREYLELLMAVENERLSRLIDNFLTFSRLERQQHRFELAPVVRGRRRHRGRRRGPRSVCRHPCDLRVDIEPNLPPVLAEREGVTTALINLLDNAIKYSPADKRIVVEASRDGDGVRRLRGDRQRHRHRAARTAADLPPLLSRRPAARQCTPPASASASASSS